MGKTWANVTNCCSNEYPRCVSREVVPDSERDQQTLLCTPLPSSEQLQIFQEPLWYLSQACRATAGLAGSRRAWLGLTLGWRWDPSAGVMSSFLRPAGFLSYIRTTKAKGQPHVIFKPLPVPHWPVLVTVKFRVKGQESPYTRPAAVENRETGVIFQTSRMPFNLSTSLQEGLFLIYWTIVIQWIIIQHAICCPRNMSIMTNIL